MKSSRFLLILLFLLVFGVIVFAWGILGDDPGRAWQAFLINLLFFSAVAQSGPVLAAIYHLTEARWGSRVIPLALGMGSFLPMSLFFFAVLLVGFPYFPTNSPEFPARDAWFHRSFLIGRNILGLAFLYFVSLAFSYQFLNSSINEGPRHTRVTAVIDHGAIAEPRHERGEINRNARKLTLLAVLVLGMYAVVFSMIGFDLVMALDHRWYSTLFGGYFFISSFYVGLAAITVTVTILRKYSKLNEEIQSAALWDLGKLVFAFCLLTAYFLWAQYLVTWYGNLPEEIGFFMIRLQNPSWAWLTWTALGLTFAVPFLTLLSQKAKQSSPVLCFVAIIALAGMWLERYLLVVPSLALNPGPRLGWIETVITVSFLAAMVFSYSVYLQLILPRWTGTKISVS